MKCPRCEQPLRWQGDFGCDEVYDCCGKGVVAFYDCPNCGADVQITTDCEGDEFK